MTLFQAEGGHHHLIKKKVTSADGVFTVVTADAYTGLTHITVHNITTGTEALTIAIYDGTTRYYLRNAQAMAAKDRIELDLGYPLDKQDTVEVTVAASGSVDVFAAVVSAA